MHSYVLMGLDQNKALESAKQAIRENTDIYKRFAKPIFQPITPQIDNCMFWETVKQLKPDIPRFNDNEKVAAQALEISNDGDEEIDNTEEDEDRE